MAQGGVSGGHAFYAKGGRPKYAYNFFGIEQYSVEGTESIPPGKHQVRMEFTYDGGGVGKGGAVGDEYGSPVTTDYTRRRFTGDIEWVEIDLGLDDHNHLIRPEDRLNLAMGIQWPATRPKVAACGQIIAGQRCTGGARRVR